MSGMIISDPARCHSQRALLERLLHDYDLPLAAFTDAPAEAFAPVMTRAAFLRTASVALLIPGQPLPMEALLTYLPDDPAVGNILRQHLFLQMSLMPYLRPGRTVTPLEGCFLLGEDILIAPVSPEDTVDARLPSGVWTELNGACHKGQLRCMRSYRETPILVRPNALLPVSMNGQSLTQTTGNDADRLTLHWFQPEVSASCTLADGTAYHVQRTGEQIDICTNTSLPFHLIVHQEGEEQIVR